MIVTERTKLGKILRNPTAKAALLEVMPELDDSPHLDLMKGLSLERVAEFAGRDRAWTDAIVVALGDVEDVDIFDANESVERYDPIDDGATSSAVCTSQSSVPRWGVQELICAGPSSGNPFLEVSIRAVFRQRNRSVEVPGFYDGGGTYRVRFMPDREGPWSFRVESNVRSMDAVEGAFECRSALPGHHGPVGVAETFHFAHADGTPYRPFGTTCYSWSHQDENVEVQTLATLAASPFNKVRMCVFPKAYLYNQNEPSWHAFEQFSDGSFDFTRFNPSFFQHLEERVVDLADLGIEADLILFHPYDRWGYSELPPQVDDRYLHYVVARLAAHKNVWWSLANEYDLMWAKEDGDWDRFGSLVRDADPYDHLIGVHQCFDFFDNSKAWVTHSSLQRVDRYRTAENTSEWREEWHKPVVIDECAYEGDIDMTWGNISGEEMTRRVWEGTARGGYVGHGETYFNPEEVLWWSKGGQLHGTSPARIAFLRSILEQGPDYLEPIREMSALGYSTVGERDRCYLQYLGIFQPRWRIIQLPVDQTYRAEVIDTWNMTIADAGTHKGDARIELPGSPYMAIRLVRVG